MSPVIGWLIGTGVALIIEALLVWRVMRALGSGTIKCDPLSWLNDEWSLELTFAQMTNPVLYWLSVLATVGVAVVIPVVFVVIAVAELRS